MLNDCYVEIEKTEDFVLFLQGNVKSLYQVKAYLSKDKHHDLFLTGIIQVTHTKIKLMTFILDCAVFLTVK